MNSSLSSSTNLRLVLVSQSQSRLGGIFTRSYLSLRLDGLSQHCNDTIITKKKNVCSTQGDSLPPLFLVQSFFQFHDRKLFLFGISSKTVVAKLNEPFVRPCSAKNFSRVCCLLSTGEAQSGPFSLCSEHICVRAAKRMQSRVALALLLSVCPRQPILGVSPMCLGGCGGWSFSHLGSFSLPLLIPSPGADVQVPSAKQLRPGRK